MDTSRRKFLKIILIGSGVLLVEKVFGPFFSRFLDDSLTKTNSKTSRVVENKKKLFVDSLTKTNSNVFRIIEKNKKLSIYDSYGEEIFQIDTSA